ALHASMLDGTHLSDRPIGEHHSARVDAQMAWKLQRLVGELENVLGNIVILRLDDGSPALDLRAPGVLLTRAVAEGLRHVAHGSFGAVADDVADLRRVVPPVRLIDILDHLFTPPGVE